MSNPKSTHNQPVTDPIAYFKAIPWCAKLISDKSVVQVTVPDRTPIASTESAFVRETLNTPETVKACITFFRFIKPTAPTSETSEDKKNPFLELCTLVDLNSGVNGYAKTAHGGFFGVVLDEVMGTAANLQAAQGAYTASLKVDFKKPLYTPSVVLVRGKVQKKEGRRLIVKGSFEDKDGNVLAVADGLWVMVNRDIGRWTDSKL
ncbi:HotDog domain-containing protein [Rhexocercosporidium sp. MPI-PUGE-AT-0058]|nr:HotDog domain-containing protein [Rhexocercosporidium sp. MPI-PUGE-AT-0058]